MVNFLDLCARKTCKTHSIESEVPVRSTLFVDVSNSVRLGLPGETALTRLVEIAAGTVTGSNQRFNPDPVAEVFVTAASSRTFREPGIESPGLPDLPVWDGNPEVFELDPDKLGLPNQIIPAGSSFKATGVIGFEFGDYELWPSYLAVTEAPLPRPVRHRRWFETTVGSLNLFRLFDDVDDPPGANAFGEPTDDDGQVVSAEEVRERVPESVRARSLDFTQCPRCARVFWRGSHTGGSSPSTAASGRAPVGVPPRSRSPSFSRRATDSPTPSANRENRCSQ